MNDYLKAFKESIEKMGIYNLRGIARSVGVSSPTTKRREELITEIMLIKSGKKVPDIKSRAGRPFKAVASGIDAMAGNDKLSNELSERISVLPKPSAKALIFRQNDEFSGSKTMLVKGVLRLTAEGLYYFVNFNSHSEKNFVVVNPSIVEMYKIIVGDMITGVARTSGEDLTVVTLEALDTINDVCAKDAVLLKNQQFVLPECNKPLIDEVYEGMGALCSHCDNIGFIENNIEKLTQNDYVCVVLAIECSINTSLRLSKIKNLEKIITYYDDNTIFSVDAVNDCINYVKSLALRGKKVVLFILDIITIVSVLDWHYVNSGHKLTPSNTLETMQTIRSLTAMSMCKDHSSITVVSLYNGEDESIKEIKAIRKAIKR